MHNAYRYIAYLVAASGGLLYILHRLLHAIEAYNAT